MDNIKLVTTPDPARQMTFQKGWCGVAGVSVMAVIMAYIAAMFWICVKKYGAFGYRDWDLAIYANFCHNACTGNFQSSLLGTAFFGNHLNLLMLAIAPIYWLFPSPITLLLIQTVALGSAAYVLFLIARRELPQFASFLIACLYLIHPGTLCTNLNEFHPESFFPLLFCLTFHQFMTDRIKLFLLFAFLCLLLKENLALTVAMLGVYCAVVKKHRAGWLVFLVSALWFCVSTGLLIPSLNKGVIGLRNIYPDFGNTPFMIVKNVILHPLKVLEIACRVDRLAYMGKLLCPLAFLPLLGLQVSALSLPIIMQHLLSVRSAEYSIWYYYSAEILPPCFIGAVYGLKIVLSHLRGVAKPAIMTLIFGIAVVSSISIGPFSKSRLPALLGELKRNELDMEKARILSEVPAGAPSVSTFEFLPALSNRKELYSFHYVFVGSTILGGRPYRLPDTVKYALVDFNDAHTFGWYYTPAGCDNVKNLMAERDFGVLDCVDSLVLFGEGAHTDLWLYRIEASPVDNFQNIVAVDVDESIRLRGWRVLGSGRSDVMDVTFRWECLRRTERDIGASLHIVNAAGDAAASTYHPLGWRSYPTSKWEAGQIVEDRMRILNPDARPGESWDLRMTFVDDRTDVRCSINGGSASNEVRIGLSIPPDVLNSASDKTLNRTVSGATTPPVSNQE